MSIVDVIPLPVFPWPVSEARMGLLKAAKARISTDVRIVPQEAAYGSPGRVLAWGAVPPFTCKSVPIRAENAESIDSIEAALRFWLEDFGDTCFDEAWLYSQWMGCDVRLVHEEDQAGKVRFV
ncbi:hypothetical protein [Microbacterium sp.]|uniref:hypothetical protein n=1 Tax=Microbacterium sp. TaxID=51671 RepID=UPI0039E25098